MMLYIPSTYMSSGKIVCLHPTISATITHVFYTLAVLRASLSLQSAPPLDVSRLSIGHIFFALTHCVMVRSFICHLCFSHLAHASCLAVAAGARFSAFLSVWAPSVVFLRKP